MYPAPRPRRRWLRWFLVYCAGVAALFVIGLVIEAAVTPDSKGQQSFTYSVPTPPWVPGAAPTPRPSAKAASPAPLSGPVALVPGDEVINGVSLGFPHTTAGAVSAGADVVDEVLSTLDPDRAAAVARMTAETSYADGPQMAAHGAIEDRQSLGLPAAGPVPASYSLVVQAVEYQAGNVTAGSALVLLLCDFTTTQPGLGTQTRVGVFPVQMHWADADWKVASFGTSSYVSLAAEPYSPQAAQLGWQELLPQEATANVRTVPVRPSQLPGRRGKRGSK